MLYFASGLVVFFGVHMVPVFPALRAQFIAVVGRSIYLAVFTLFSAIGLILIIVGYGELRWSGDANPEIWAPPEWTRHIAFTLMLPVFILLAAAYIPNRIRGFVGHPMLAAIKLWAFAHLLANGDLASVLLFASFLIYAIIDRISVKRRNAPGPLGERAGSLAGDVAVVVVGLAAYGFMLFYGHTWLVGIPLVSAG